jgi:hypothetical protein
MGIIAKKTGFGGGWTWELPEGCQTTPSVPIKNNGSLGQPWQASGDEKPPSDYDHDKQREHEARQAMADGDFKATRRSAERIRGRKQCERVLEEIEAAEAASMVTSGATA